MGLPRHHQHFFKFFEWQRNDTPLSSPTSVASILAAYLVTVTLGTHCVKRPLPLPRVVIAFHNLVLCLGSLVMFIGTAHESFRVRLCISSSAMTSLNNWRACSLLAMPYTDLGIWLDRRKPE